MPLDPKTKKNLARLADRDRAARRKAEDARDELLEAILDVRAGSTVREIAEATGISFQRVHELTTVRNRRTAKGRAAAAGREQT